MGDVISLTVDCNKNEMKVEKQGDKKENGYGYIKLDDKMFTEGNDLTFIRQR